MIKGRAGNMLLIGITDENIKRLKEEQPIAFHISQAGFDFVDVNVLVFHGKDEKSIERVFRDAGFIVDDTEIVKD